MPETASTRIQHSLFPPDPGQQLQQSPHQDRRRRGQQAPTLTRPAGPPVEIHHVTARLTGHQRSRGHAERRRKRAHTGVQLTRCHTAQLHCHGREYTHTPHPRSKTAHTLRNGGHPSPRKARGHGHGHHSVFGDADGRGTDTRTATQRGAIRSRRVEDIGRDPHRPGHHLASLDCGYRNRPQARAQNEVQRTTQGIHQPGTTGGRQTCGHLPVQNRVKGEVVPYHPPHGGTRGLNSLRPHAGALSPPHPTTPAPGGSHTTRPSGKLRHIRQKGRRNKLHRNPPSRTRTSPATNRNSPAGNRRTAIEYPPGVKPLRAAIYCRVSTDEQAQEGLSIQAQKEALHQYAISHGMEVVAEYIDEGESARTADRPQFQAMIRAAKHKPPPFEVILVHKGDRFARNREDAIVFKSLLRRECGIEVISILEPFDNSPTGRLMEGILEVIAEFYSLNLAQEVKKGMTVRASQARALGMCPFGITVNEDGTLRPVPEEAAIVKWIFEEYTKEEAGLLKIAEFLRNQGPAIFGPAAQKMKWSSIHVRNIIKNPIYTGTFVWNRRATVGKRQKFRDTKDWIVVENALDPIVSTELFERANSILRERRGRRSPNIGDYLLRGLVFCKDCGASMSHYPMQWPTRNGTTIRHKLACTRYLHSKACYFNHVNMDELEKMVFDAIEHELGGPPASQYRVTYTAPEEMQRQIKRLNALVSSYDERLSRLIAAYSAGVLDLAELRAGKEKLVAERAEAERQLAALKHSLQNPPAWGPNQQSLVKQALKIIADPTLPPARRRQALQTCLSRVLYSRRNGELEVVLKLEPEPAESGRG